MLWIKLLQCFFDNFSNHSSFIVLIWSLAFSGCFLQFNPLFSSADSIRLRSGCYPVIPRPQPCFFEKIRHNFRSVARGTELHKDRASVDMNVHFQLIQQQFNVSGIVHSRSTRQNIESSNAIFQKSRPISFDLEVVSW